jgi:hypothetical protein
MKDYSYTISTTYVGDLGCAIGRNKTRGDIALEAKEEAKRQKWLEAKRSEQEALDSRMAIIFGGRQPRQ